jgi:hypothetical protein
MPSPGRTVILLLIILIVHEVAPRGTKRMKEAS